MIRQNYMRGESDESVGAVRAGQGLLTGLLRCKRCGRKIYVRYSGKSGTIPRYLCSGSFNADGGKYCIGFGGTTVDKRFSEEIVLVVSPLGIRASLEAIERLGSEQDARCQATRRRVEQLSYEAARAFEQYDEVDPRNRLVVSELERRWNEKLEELERVRGTLTELEQSRQQATTEERERLMMLGRNFGEVWNDPACPVELKKKIVRSLVEEVLVDEEPLGKLAFIIHWKGGSHTSFEMDKPPWYGIRKTAMEDLEIIGKMGTRYGDNVIAAVLNKLGRRTGAGKPWSQNRVKTVRRNYGIDGHSCTVDDPEILSLKGASRYTGTSDTTIMKLVNAGILPMNQVVPFAPWEIKRSDLDSAPVSNILQQLKKTGKLVLEGDTSALQVELFQ